MFVLVLTFSACTWLSPGFEKPALLPSPVQTASSVPVQVSPRPAVIGEARPEPEPARLLPRPLYYLSNQDGESVQIWRISSNGIDQVKVTRAESSVTDFDINLLNGQIAFIAGGQIYLAEAWDKESRLISKTGSQGEAGLDSYSAPRWSPDGQFLAVAHQGVSLLQPQTGDLLAILPDQPDAKFLPYAWSPDGRHLLIEIASKENGATLGILSLEDRSWFPLQAPPDLGPTVCCQAAWSPDSNTVYIANPYQIPGSPGGLWRFPLERDRGITLIAPLSSNKEYNYAGWPDVSANGELTYFFASAPSKPDRNIPLYPVRSALDGITDRRLLRNESMLPVEALWDENGGSVVIVQSAPGSSWSPGGPVLLVKINQEAANSMLLPLIPYGYRLHWGF